MKLFQISPVPETGCPMGHTGLTIDHWPIFAIANLWFICTIMSRQLRSSWVRTHPSIHRSIRLCTTPSFCKQPFVNGKVANPKSIAGDTTAANNFSRKTKETCLFNRICLYLRNLFQATCRRWSNSEFLLAKKNCHKKVCKQDLCKMDIVFRRLLRSIVRPPGDGDRTLPWHENFSPLEWKSKIFHRSSWFENMVCCVPGTILEIC